MVPAMIHESWVGIGSDGRVEVRCTCGWRRQYDADSVPMFKPFGDFAEHGWDLMGQRHRHNINNFWAFDPDSAKPRPTAGEPE